MASLGGGGGIAMPTGGPVGAPTGLARIGVDRTGAAAAVAAFAGAAPTGATGNDFAFASGLGLAGGTLLCGLLFTAVLAAAGSLMSGGGARMAGELPFRFCDLAGAAAACCCSTFGSTTALGVFVGGSLGGPPLDPSLGASPPAGTCSAPRWR